MIFFFEEGVYYKRTTTYVNQQHVNIFVMCNRPGKAQDVRQRHRNQCTSGGEEAE